MAWRTYFQKVSSGGDPSLSAPVLSKTSSWFGDVLGLGTWNGEGDRKQQDSGLSKQSLLPSRPSWLPSFSFSQELTS